MSRPGLTRVLGLLCVVLGVPGLGASQALAARWVRQTIPTTSTNKDNWLFGVSCGSTRACMAVGWSIDADTVLTFIEQWNGSSWRIVSSPDQPSGGNRLLNVSCASPTDCVAVGENILSSGATRALIERWDGSTWTIDPAASHRGAADTSLSAVSCPGASDCTAVGSWDRGAGGEARTLIEHWNGSGWRVQRTPRGGGLTGISCTSARFCLAIGSQLERWNGRRWSALRPLRFGGWTAVSCSSSRACMAVGGKLRSLRWTGSRLITEPVHTGHQALYDAVSCVSGKNCAAVGYSNAFTTRAARWTGTRWVFQPTPSPVPRHSLLNAVSCPSRRTCIAVGLAGSVPLVERRG